MERQAEKIVEEIEVPVLDEDGNIIDIKIEKKVSWGLPKGYSGPFYDETITDEDRLADAWDEVRDVRKSLLKVVDVYQGTLLYNSLTKTKQNQLAKYRQALLDITNQESPEEAMKSFPKTPKWLK
tara:strand:+ start:2011 stop:2385 length:375 start_codon:yes stop_codon:yes gene_type:complete